MWVAEPKRRTKIFGEFDVVVIGGSPAAGSAAALQVAGAFSVDRLQQPLREAGTGLNGA